MITIKKLITPEDISKFWEKLKIHQQQDVFKDLDAADQEYFSGPDYYDAIMNLHQNPLPGAYLLEFVFFYEEGTYIGFSMYKIYNLEDGKAFILEFGIDKPFRNRGVGRTVVQIFEAFLKSQGAAYFALNTSNENNLRFWQRLGFVPDKEDEWGSMIYVKK